MSKPMDLQGDALKTLEAFALRCDGRGAGEVYDAFAAMAARLLNAMAVILETSAPDDPDCALCRSAKDANEAAHELARVAGKMEKVH